MGLEITKDIDFALVALNLFVAFFAGLVFYLHRESKREGYPLLSDDTRGRAMPNPFPTMPQPKTYLLPHGGTVTVPNSNVDARPIAARPIGNFPGAPLEPTGNPMRDAVGPASYAERADVPDLTYEGEAKIVPMRNVPDFSIASRDPDPRGMQVIGADGKIAGTVADLWVDRGEYLFRYIEVELATDKRHVLLPMNFARVNGARRRVTVKAILASQFADVPGIRNPAQITFLEEDRIMGYYGGGYLYATKARAEPML